MQRWTVSFYYADGTSEVVEDVLTNTSNAAVRLAMILRKSSKLPTSMAVGPVRQAVAP